MKSITVSKSAFKPRAYELFRLVAAHGDEIVVTDRGRPVARVVACTDRDDEILASLRCSVLHFDDPLAPVDDQWDAL